MLARSRLNSLAPKPAVTPPPLAPAPVAAVTRAPVTATAPPSARERVSLIHQKTRNPYRARLPLLVISASSYAVVSYIFLRIQPESIAHVPLPFAYAPLHIPFFIGSFFLWSYLFLNTRRGFLTAIALSLLLFLKLQLVLISPILVVGVVGMLLLSEVTITSLLRRSKR